jgi:hypothetical protein
VVRNVTAASAGFYSFSLLLAGDLHTRLAVKKRLHGPIFPSGGINMRGWLYVLGPLVFLVGVLAAAYFSAEEGAVAASLTL